MTTTASNCRAKNPHFCRYHGTEGADYESRAERSFTYLTTKLAESKEHDERYELGFDLQEAALEYAATDKGGEYFNQKLAEAGDDWAEKERLETLLEDAARLRSNMEDKADGIVKFPASKLEEAENRIAKANRKLERAGIEERFTYTTEEYIETDKEGHQYKMVALALSHPTLSYNGWSFVAAVDKLEDGSVITKTLPSQELNGYRPESFQCEHCGSNRRRNSTYLVRNEEGEYKQVGSNCLKSFLGVSPQALWALNYDPEEKDEFIDRGRRSYGGADTLIPTTELVAAALAVSEGGNKYVSNSTASEWGVESTTSQVRGYFFDNKRDKWKDVEHTDYMEQAKNIMNSTTFEGEDDYNTNMRQLVAQDNTDMKHMGYVTSVISAYRRQQAKANYVAKPKAVGFLGQEKDKIKDVKVTVKTVRTLSGFYNGYERTSTMIIMEDEKGREVKWNATGSKNYKEGSQITISSATIKGLGEYNGNEQTIITRAKVLEPEESD